VQCNFTLENMQTENGTSTVSFDLPPNTKRLLKLTKLQGDTCKFSFETRIKY